MKITPKGKLAMGRETWVGGPHKKFAAANSHQVLIWMNTKNLVKGGKLTW